jgi:hypothetical protein
MTMSAEKELREAENEQHAAAERLAKGLQPPLKELVGEGKSVYFRYYRDNALWYAADPSGHNFMFPVPISDAGTATFKDSDKAIFFMRWIRKHITELEAEAAEARKA